MVLLQAVQRRHESRAWCEVCEVEYSCDNVLVSKGLRVGSHQVMLAEFVAETKVREWVCDG